MNTENEPECGSEIKQQKYTSFTVKHVGYEVYSLNSIINKQCGEEYS